MEIKINTGFNRMKKTREYKGMSLLKPISDYVVIDLETTGLSPNYDDIIEIGAIKVKNDKIVGEFQSLINPNYEIDEFIIDFTGITNEMLFTAPEINDVLPLFLDFVGDNIIIGHNVNFDINFLYDNCVNILNTTFKNDFIDTMRLSRRMFKEHRHHTLTDLVSRFDIKAKVEHRALVDVLCTNDCFIFMKNYANENNIELNSSYAPGSFSVKDITTDETEFNEDSDIFGNSFCFTGVLERMVRKEAMQIVVDQGGMCSDSVNKNTNYLVLGNNDYVKSIKNGKSSKQKKAEQLKLAGKNIEIISENVFYDMLELK